MFEKIAVVATNRYIELCKKAPTIAIVHSAAYGLGIICQRLSKEAFKQMRNDILQTISNIVTAPDAFSTETKAGAAESAIGTLGKIALYQYDKNDKLSEEILIKFLQFLPLKNDFAEAQQTHKLLLEEIIKKNEALVSASQEVQNLLLQAVSNINKIDVNNPESELLDEEGRKMMQQVLNSA